MNVAFLDFDDDMKPMHFKKSDLDKVRSHLILTIYYSENKEEEGLLPKHKEDVGKILQNFNLQYLIFMVYY